MTKWTEIFEGASYHAEPNKMTISTLRTPGKVIALTRLNSRNVFRWANQTDMFRYYTLHKGANGIYPVYAVSVEENDWVVISRIRFGIVGTQVKADPFTMFSNCVNGNDVKSTLKSLEKSGLKLDSNAKTNADMLANLAENIIFIRQVLAGEADIARFERQAAVQPKTAAPVKTPAPAAIEDPTPEKVIDATAEKLGNGKSKKTTRRSTKKAPVEVN